MLTRLFTSAIVLGLSAYTTGALVDRQGTETTAPGYTWADACRKCHEPVYEAWSHTKHASALDRLSSAEQEKECVGCHVTGPGRESSTAEKYSTRACSVKPAMEQARRMQPIFRSAPGS
jgi:hypothetical protein